MSPVSMAATTAPPFGVTAGACPPRYAVPLPPPMHELMRMEAIAAIITDMPFVILGRPLFLPG